MKQNIIHSILFCMAALTLSFMAACSSQEESLPDNVTEAALYLNIATIGQTKASTAELPYNEKMRSVRVIILHADGTVEHNRYYSLEGAQAQKYILLKVKPNEKKKIFLFANEESVSTVEGGAGENRTLTAFFNSYIENMSGFDTAVNSLYFAPDYSDGKPIPMSSMYEIDFPTGQLKKTFYVVRVATKFTINFMNWRGEKVTVTDFTISNHADKNFLMAHVNDSEQNRQLFKGKTWIEWLREVSDASSEDDGDAATDDVGWLKDYDLPADANLEKTFTYTMDVTVGMPKVDLDYPGNSKPGTVEEPPVFYLPESMNLKAEEPEHGEQEYTLTIRIDGRAEPLVCPLENLKALFRNTHVIVNITMYQSMEIKVDVIPYSEKNLEPVFGL